MVKPILYHVSTLPLRYQPTLLLQNQIHALQLARRRVSADYPDVLLLLQHRPVFTAGRRQNDTLAEEERLRKLGADWVSTSRGGQTTYHGPGQIVGYPMFDIGRMGLSPRTYVCYLEKMLQKLALDEHGLAHYPSEHTGLFLGPTLKVGSIGVQIRHRLTTHGFAVNITCEPTGWFDQVVACGLADVKAESISGAVGKDTSVEEEMPKVVDVFGKIFKREMRELSGEGEDEIMALIAGVEEDARRQGEWLRGPSIASA
ncbi:hypothetical protein BOTBODRAFT_53073 [Botryobasidium botryosum FD-172 SS1]|uniref:Octanoyltransferase n=1 Tax=Botryobasidium botryosum (strain FD-172 SS1) TaxID=930990 RepID=A0A067MPJ0_BOTB1|nr:hypothetical protein BOTBODRAFT_53073 [Botryobasidium botryosum FD-172 SS1]